MKIATLAAWLYAQALTMPQSYAPGETVDQHHARVGTIATAVATAVMPYANGKAWTASELGLAVVVLMGEESRFDERVHAGLKHPKWTSDRGLARCLGQPHVSGLVPRSDWERLAGTDEDATLRCARATTLIWVAQARQCGVFIGQRAARQGVAAVFMAYGSGGNCKPDDRAWGRSDKWLAMIAKRPDRAPVKGYRRTVPQEVPESIRASAAEIVSEIGTEPKTGPGAVQVGFVRHEKTEDGTRYALLVEHHAEGKVGVSVLVKE